MLDFSKIRSFFIGRYRSLDKGFLCGIFILMLFGVFLTFAASPEVARRHNMSSFYFASRQLIFFGPTLGVLFFMAFLKPAHIRFVCWGILIVSLCLMIYVLLFGAEVKGARRWIYLFQIGLQPSEFAKPAFAVICAWLLASGRLIRQFPGYIRAFALYCLVAVLLWKQPDIGMLMTVTAVFGAELLLSGLPLSLISILGLLFSSLGGLAYLFQDHVRSRIDRFFSGSGQEAYQVQKSLEALRNAGWFGKGPGEGTVKSELPDAHTDFILAVSAEEFGFLLTFLLLVVFVYLIVRGFMLIQRENNYFSQIAVGGLLTQIAFQAMVNMASTLHLMPTKGMTLPFISYGGSSLVSMGLVFGIILGLTRYHTLSKGLE